MLLVLGEVLIPKLASVLALLLVVSPVHAKKTVELCTDDSCAVKVTHEKLDCAIHKNKKKALSFGFKLSVAFAAKAGPEVTFGRSAEINWNSMSQELIRRYEELCDMHNKGLFTVAKFNDRYEKLESYFEKAKDLKVEIEDTVQARADKAFSDLDKESEAHAGSTVEKAKEKVSQISNQVESLAKELKDLDGSGKGETTDKPETASP